MEPTTDRLSSNSWPFLLKRNFAVPFCLSISCAFRPLPKSKDSPRFSFRNGFTKAIHVSDAFLSIKLTFILASATLVRSIFLVRVPNKRAGITFVLFKTNLSPGRKRRTKSFTK